MCLTHHSSNTDTDIGWLTKVPIGPYIDAVKQYLTERRYASSNLAGYMV